MLDHLIAVCKSCGHTVRISVEHGGRRAKCPKCSEIIEIPKGETSIRLRSDRELTREARAKAGRGPDSDSSTPAARSKHGGTARVPKKPAPAPKSKAKGKLTLVLTLVATGLVLAGIVFIMARGSSGGGSSAAPPPSTPPARKTPPPPPPPPSPPPDPNAAQRSEILARLEHFVKAFNTHDLNKMAPYYTAEAATLTKAFGALGVDAEVTYEKFEAKSIEFAPEEIKMTIVVDRVVSDTETGKSDKQTGVQRQLTWIRRNEKWVISSPPEP